MCTLFGASLLATLIPTILYARWLRWFDRFERTYSGLGMTAFFWGLIPACVLAVIGEIIFDAQFDLSASSANTMLSSSIGAPLIEEIAKAVILFILFFKLSRDHDSPIVWIIYGAMAGFGFALTENLLYFIDAAFSGSTSIWTYVVFIRSILFGLNHAFYTSLTGIGLGLARMKNISFFARVIFILTGLGTAMLFHSIHNLGMELSVDTEYSFFVSLLTDWGGVVIVGILMLLIKMDEKVQMLTELREEIETGLIDADDYKLACSWRVRFWTRILGWMPWNYRARRRLSHLVPLLADLALAKHLNHRPNRDYGRIITEIRYQVAGVRSALGNG